MSRPLARMARALSEIARALDELDQESVAPDGADLIDQHHPASLGRRKQPAVVRARRARGEPGAFILGRRFCLTTGALAEERERASSARGRGRKATSEAPAGSVANELELELKLVRGCAR
jgi:hypothetical protein